MMHPKLWRQYHGPQTRQHLNQSFRQQYLLVMATVSVKRFRASTLIPFALAAATGGLVGCLAVEPTGPSEVPVGSVPDPTLLPVARGQVPNLVAYLALNLPSRPAGFSYTDPVTGVKVWKVTSSTTPAPNTGAGHDYSDGPNEVSLGWGANHTTHTILIRGDGMAYSLVDFTRGVGFTNYRALPVQPRQDLAATFSNVAGNERILYILTNSQIVRFNTATMLLENKIGRAHV